MSRRGHSLPELIVAIALLGTAVAAVGASSVVGARWAAEGFARQEAVRAGMAVLDSLAAVASPSAGSRVGERLTVRWRVEPMAGGAVIRATVLTVDGGRVLASLIGPVVPAIAIHPDEAPTSGGRGAP